MGRASLKHKSKAGRSSSPEKISRPYGPGLIEAMTSATMPIQAFSISRPYGPGLIEARGRSVTASQASVDFPALWAGPH